MEEGWNVQHLRFGIVREICRVDFLRRRVAFELGRSVGFYMPYSSGPFGNHVGLFTQSHNAVDTPRHLGNSTELLRRRVQAEQCTIAVADQKLVIFKQQSVGSFQGIAFQYKADFPAVQRPYFSVAGIRNVNRFFLDLYCFLLPFGLVDSLGWITPFITVFIGYTFVAFEAIADELEDPFGTEPNDLPLNALSRMIETTLLEMAGKPVPEPAQPNGYMLD